MFSADVFFAHTISCRKMDQSPPARERLPMKPITADSRLVACCGLYCGACGAYYPI